MIVQCWDNTTKNFKGVIVKLLYEKLSSEPGLRKHIPVRVFGLATGQVVIVRVV